MKKIRIGGGAGFAGDRVDPAVTLIEKGNLDYIIFECLAERTIGLAKQEMLHDPTKGYSRLLEYRLSQTLKPAKEHGVKIITNMGAVNPHAAVAKAIEIAKEQGISGLKFAAVTGDDVYDVIEKYYDEPIFEFPGKIGDYRDAIVSANAYMGAEGIIRALADGADVVITSRVSDPTLTLAPLCYEYGWTIDDAEKMGQCVLAGHLIECGGQVTGGYYADPGYKEVPNLDDLGFPIVEFDETGRFIVTKVEGTGGVVCVDTCKEQMLYEIHDPSRYLTPDCIADFTGVKFTQEGENIVSAWGATSHGLTPTLKVNVCYRDSFITDCEISYGGCNALERAKLAGDMFIKRLDRIGIEYTETRVDYIGYNSLYKDKLAEYMSDGRWGEIRLHVAVRTKDRANAVKVSNEGDSIYTNGPAGGGGATMRISEIINVFSFFIPRELLAARVEYEVI
ncbi:MAG: DUF1446 domain-containing protein [Lachnospiraceae bacterium]|nr:DUF1446 domain-containing protein [Lachnospiraceae bacterium]